jgi:hypothetical protein
VNDSMDALARELQRVEALISSIPDHEVGYVFRTDGGLVLVKEAPEDDALTLSFSEDECAQVAGCVFTHNHPGHGSSFSPQDIKFAYKNRLSELRAVSKRYLYRLCAPNVQFDPDEFDRIITPAYDRKKDIIGPLIHKELQEGRLTASEADERFPHDLWVELVREIGLPYERLDRPPAHDLERDGI